MIIKNWLFIYAAALCTADFYMINFDFCVNAVIDIDEFLF